MILSIVRGYFKSLFGKKTNTRETWKTGFKPNILEVNLKDLTSKKKKKKTTKKKEREEEKTHKGKKKKRSGTRSMSHFNDFRRKRNVTPLD